MDVPIDKLRALPLEKRLEIIEALWESVEAELGPEPVSDERADELDRKFAAHLADPSSSLPWAQVRAGMRERHGGSGPGQSTDEVRLSEGERAEIDRRLAAHKLDPGAARPVGEFLDELDRRYA
jgi:putative addiction module component (TIGR02574 family)